MAQKLKRPSPHVLPPSDSSDDEPIPSPQPNAEKDDEEEDPDDQSSSEEEEEDDDDAEPEEEQTQSQSKNPKSDDSSESDTDSGSESESESRDASNYHVQPKPLASKPVDETPIKVESKSLKRPAESNGNGDVSRAKKKMVTDAAAVAAASSESSDDDEDDDDDGGVDAAEVKKSNGTASDSKSFPFQRLFSEEDDIAILNGLIEFTKETGKDPFRFFVDFHGFMKKLLHIDCSSSQLRQKIQRLKRKFTTKPKRKSFSKRHDEEVFELCKKIWGNEVVEKAKSYGKVRESARKKRSTRESKQEVKLAGNMEMDEKIDIPCSMAHGFGLYGMVGNVTKKGLDLMEASDKAEMEKEWEEIEVAEFELSLKRAELAAKHGRLIWKAYQASNH